MPCNDGPFGGGPDESVEGYTVDALTQVLCQLDRATRAPAWKGVKLPALFVAWQKRHRAADAQRLKDQKEDAAFQRGLLRKRLAETQRELRRLSKRR